ncbi:MAG: LPS-assembly protein LptD [Alphaproteobacteria bacterium]|nr:LPS-assembly protein LptD [Alphaproteobacteria bacterium]MCK5658806.1 LPS-assembly protein LptD [Alphaproteobacteria bacterium]
MFFRIIILTMLFLMTGASAGYASVLSMKGETRDLPVNFTAKALSSDDVKQTVTAVGDVELMQGKQILRADRIVYHLNEDRVEATGNVSLLDESGDVHFAEAVELHNNMKDGFVRELLSLLADGSRFTAGEARRENDGKRTVMVDATYTVCRVCEADPHPLWQIKADKVVHDADTKKVNYKNARLELMGMPVAYSPIFSHPDPTLKRKSGFLRPEYGWTTELGTHLKVGYYYDIAPNRDMTLQVEPTALAGTLVEGEWRERFKNGKLQINVSTANSDRKEEDGRVETSRQRGHIVAEGLFDLNDMWRSGVSFSRSTDKEYLRLYDISRENVLNSQIYAERFSGRDYSRISAFGFQDVRLGVRPDQPYIFPMMEHTMIGEPNSLLGGRWQIGASALGLVRDSDSQDVQRASVTAGWERRDVSSLGLVTVATLDGRGDVYGVQNSDAADIDPALDSNPETVRGMVTASVISSYPMVRPMRRSQIIIEPSVGVSVSPMVNEKNDIIPNEDSIDIQFDTNNLFSENRYPGIDRQEDGGRLNYGVKAGWYGDDGRYGRIFLGQSYRFYGDMIFPEGSGLEDRHSDFVGQIKIGLSKYMDLDYRFQLDNDTLATRRHEIQAGGGNDRFRLEGRYLYTAAVAGTGFTESRQQIQTGGTYNITKSWKFRASGLMDLGDQPGLRNASTGIDYSDECFTFSVMGSRNVADEASGDDETKLIMRIGLRSIGEFSAPEILLGGDQLIKPPGK